MPNVVTAGAMLTCSFGVAPTALVVTAPRPLVEGRPAATITDITPANIPTFAMCLSILNPTVLAATTAALGVLTPMACVPVIVSPWVSVAPLSLFSALPVLGFGSICTCAYGGVVSIVGPPAMTVMAS